MDLTNSAKYAILCCGDPDPGLKAEARGPRETLHGGADRAWRIDQVGRIGELAQLALVRCPLLSLFFRLFNGRHAEK